MSTSTVKCSNCTRHNAERGICSLWIEYVYNPDTDIKQGAVLLNELGNKPPFDYNALRECQHFIGQYPFVVGE